MPVVIFVSRLGIIDLVNKIQIYSNLINLFHFEIYIICSFLKALSLYVIIFGNIRLREVLFQFLFSFSNSIFYIIHVDNKKEIERKNRN